MKFEKFTKKLQKLVTVSMEEISGVYGHPNYSFLLLFQLKKGDRRSIEKLREIKDHINLWLDCRINEAESFLVENKPKGDE